MRYFAHTPSSVEHMLKAIGKNSVTELFSSIPPKARLSRDLNLPKRMDELALKRELAPFLKPKDVVSFLGAGATAHFVPVWISQQLMRAEWYTSYTPYQPEASQGTLQAIFEFQSMVASLFGMQVANGSMYDGATALTEALLMAIRAQGKKTVILCTSIHPEYREVVHNYFKLADLKVIEADFSKSGITDLEKLKEILKSNSSDLAAIAVQSPNFFGRIEDVFALSLLAHECGALLVGCMTDLSACPLLPSLAKLGADIAVGEGLGLLGSISLGGPGVGLLSCHRSLLRQMPGRLVGQTNDKNGQVGYTLTLSTREQHIRREKATSNICTNHNLMALALSMNLASYGRLGFKNLANINLRKTKLFREHLGENKHIKVAFVGPYYNETVIDFSDQNRLLDRVNQALTQNLLAGVSLNRFYDNLKSHLLVATTELHSDQDIIKLAQILKGESL